MKLHEKNAKSKPYNQTSDHQVPILIMVRTSYSTEDHIYSGDLTLCGIQENQVSVLCSVSVHGLQ